MTFRPSIGLDGFKVVSSFNVDELTCQELNDDVNQLAILLHPPEMINEKILIKMRDCVLKLTDTHPLKRWMKWLSKSRPLTKKEQKLQSFLSEIITSKFNLITDAKMKDQIIGLVQEVPEETLSEMILKSYLYLMIGNITRSDNIIKKIVTATPVENWKRSGASGGIYHKLGKDHLEQILSKISRHPTDRKSFEMLVLYLQSYYNDPSLLMILDELSTTEVTAKLDLNYIKSLAPELVQFLRLKKLSESSRFKRMRDLSKIPLARQSYWEWAFFNIDPLVSDVMNPELQRIEKADELWFIYLMNNEKLADLFSMKSGKSFLPGRRPFLKDSLVDKTTFMMALYKLLEMGDINNDLVLKTTDNLIHD